MSKKNLLNETTVRRFMKLAEIEPLTGGFISEQFPSEAEELEEAGLTAPAYQDDDEWEDEAVPETGEELEMDVELDDEPEMDIEAEEEVEVGEPGELTLTDEEAEVFLKLADKVRDAMDLAPEPEEVEAPDMGDEELEEPEEVGVEELGFEEEGEEELELEEVEVVDDESIVNEVARRVAKRLLTRKKK